MKMPLLSLLFVVLLAGCATPETRELRVEIPVGSASQRPVIERLADELRQDPPASRYHLVWSGKHQLLYDTTAQTLSIDGISYSHVTDAAIQEVAKNHTAFSALTKYGATR